MSNATAEKLLSFWFGLLCCGIGIVVAQGRFASHDGWVAFAGALIGAGASVWGAFAVVGHVANRDRQERIEVLIEVAGALRRAMAFLRHPENAEGTEAEKSAQIDRMLSSVPWIKNFLETDGFITKLGRGHEIGVVMRLIVALRDAEPKFDAAKNLRADAPSLQVGLPLPLIDKLDTCAQTTLRELGADTREGLPIIEFDADRTQMHFEAE